MADGLEMLYEKYNILSEAKDKIAEHREDFKYCIENFNKDNEKEKKLAAQIISKFFKYFPDLQEQAINAIIDLCEEVGSSVCKAAMKVLPVLCKDSKEYINKVADILTQLLTLTEGQDEMIASTCLLQVFKEDSLNTLTAIFNYVQTTEENTEKAIQFVFKKLTKIEEKLTPEITDLLIEQGKNIIQESTANEFVVVAPFLISSKLAKTSAGQQELVDAVAERAEIDKNFDHSDGFSVERMAICVDFILPLFNAHVPSTRFIKYYCDQILPKWQSIGTLKDGSDIQYHFLKHLAELSIHCGTLEEPTVQVKQIFEVLKEYMPLPPEDVDIEKIPNLDFTSVECLLYAFHRLARQCPEFLTADPAVLKDFRSRLSYFSRAVGGCKKSLDKGQPKTKDNEKLKIAPTVLGNITTLIKDLFYTPPAYKNNVHLSFKTTDNKVKIFPEETQKRHAPIHFDSSTGPSANKQVRSNKGADNVKLYTPPSGKFSNSFQNYDRSGPRGRGRGRGIRGNRSRGSWRN